MRKIGYGPHPVLLLHPYLVPSALFDSLVEPWLESHTLWLPDYRGYGSQLASEGPYTLEQYAADVAAALPLGPLDVVGYSMGGLVAQLLAHRHPQRVRRLVLGCTFAHKNQRLSERAQGMALPSVVQRLGGRGLARVMYNELRTGYKPHRNEIGKLKQLVESNRTEVIAENARELFRFDSRAWLPQLSVPTLVVAGDKDWVVPLHHARQLSTLMPHTRLEVIARGGHFLVMTHREQYWPLLFGWLSAPA